MAIFSTSRYFLALFLLIFYFRILNAELQPNGSFSFKSFGKDSNFESHLALHGDAKVVNGSLQITGSMVSSAGRVMYKTPFKLIEGKIKKKVVSFCMYFVFSLSSENGEGLVFMMVPVGFPSNVFDDSGSFGLLGERKDRFLGVEFDTFKDKKYGDLNDNHVGIDVGSLISVKSRNVSSFGLKSGEKLQAWINYEAGSKRLELRLSKLGENMPINPLISCPIDLSKMWKEDEIVMGLSASSGKNSTQECNIYSWSFKLRTTPHWMHSQPLDPNSYIEKRLEPLNHIPQKKSDCALRVVAALVFGTGCGALGALIVLFIWTILGDRRPVVPEDYVMPFPAKEIEYKMEKIDHRRW